MIAQKNEKLIKCKCKYYPTYYKVNEKEFKWLSFSDIFDDDNSKILS